MVNVSADGVAAALSGGEHAERVRGPLRLEPRRLVRPVPDDDVRELIDASYEAAVAALPKSRRPAGRESAG